MLKNFNELNLTETDPLNVNELNRRNLNELKPLNLEHSQAILVLFLTIICNSNNEMENKFLLNKKKFLNKRSFVILLIWFKKMNMVQFLILVESPTIEIKMKFTQKKTNKTSQE